MRVFRPVAGPDPHRALRPVGRFRAPGRGGAGRRRRRRRLDPCRCDGRPLRAQHHHRPGRAAGHSPLDGKAAQRSSDDRRAGALSRGLRRGRRRSSAGPGRARLHHPPASGARPDPRARQEGRRGDRPGEPAGAHRVRPASLRHHPGDDGQSRIWRAVLPARDAAQDPAHPGDVRATRSRSGDRGRWRREREDGGTGGCGRRHRDRRRLGDLRHEGLQSRPLRRSAPAPPRAPPSHERSRDPSRCAIATR